MFTEYVLNNSLQDFNLLQLPCQNHSRHRPHSKNLKHSTWSSFFSLAVAHKIFYCSVCCCHEPDGVVLEECCGRIWNFGLEKTAERRVLSELLWALGG